MQDITLALEERKIMGKKVKALLRDGYVPAVIHDHGKESIVVMGKLTQMLKAYQLAGKHHPVQITVGKHEYLALIKDAEIEPKKRVLRHVVFNAVDKNQKVEAEIPVHVEGEIPAERAGHMVLTQLHHVEVEALPNALPDKLTVDGTTLAEIGDRLTVADIKVPTGVEILTDLETQIAVVEETKEQISEEAEEVSEEISAADVPSEHGAEESAETTEE